MKTLKQRAKTSEQISDDYDDELGGLWINEIWVKLKDVKEWLQEHRNQVVDEEKQFQFTTEPIAVRNYLKILIEELE